MSYELLYQVGRADLSLYFRSLYSVFRFIENSNYKGDANFGLVVRSLLSDYELVILFYNSLSPRGEKFKRFIYKHALFDNLDPELLLDSMHVTELSVEAFGQNEEILVLFPDAEGPISESC
ncbi:putative phage abortive infection protein [compost metagenome]